MTPAPPDPRPTGLPNPLELLVFAPIGLVAILHERLRAEQHQLAQQVRLYRLVGRLTVQHSQAQLKRRIDRAVDDRRGPP